MTLKLMVSPEEGTLLITPEMHLPLPISHPRTSELKQDYSCNPRSILATPPPSQCRRNCGAGKDGVAHVLTYKQRSTALEKEQSCTVGFVSWFCLFAPVA